MRDRLLWVSLALLIVVYILLRVYILQQKLEVESFTLPNLSACPSNSKMLNDETGVNCCEGEIIDGVCTKGKVICTLSEKSGNLPRCVDYVTTQSITKGREICPKSMPNYFERDGKGFCTTGGLNQEKNGPVNMAEPTCPVLANQDERMRDRNSCFNIKMLDDMKFTIANVPYSKFSWIGSTPSGPGKVVVYGATYEVNGRINTCYDRDSIERRADAMTPGWRSDPEESQRINSTQFCAP